MGDFTQNRNRPQNSVWNIGFAGDGADPGLAVGFIESGFARSDCGRASGSRPASSPQGPTCIAIIRTG